MTKTHTPDTGRDVDERIGTHVVLWIVDNPEAWAIQIGDGNTQTNVWH